MLKVSLGLCTEDSRLRILIRIICEIILATDLVRKGMLSPLPGKVRKVEYAIQYVKADGFLKHFSEIQVEHGEKGHYLTAKFNGELIRERISDLDHEQHASGTISDSDLIHKYMAYLSVD